MTVGVKIGAAAIAEVAPQLPFHIAETPALHMPDGTASKISRILAARSRIEKGL